MSVYATAHSGQAEGLELTSGESKSYSLRKAAFDCSGVRFL